MHDFRRRKDDSPASLPAGAVRRFPPGRGGLFGAVAAAGFALLLSACGGGGAGAPNAGAALGGPAPSILADAAVAPAPDDNQTALVTNQTTPDARETPPPNPQAKAPQTRKAPPDAEETPPPTGLPPLVEIIPPQNQVSENRVSAEPSTARIAVTEPSTARITVTDPSTLPFPTGSSATDETINLNTIGTWGLPDYQPGGASAAKNNGPDVVVRRRVKRWYKDLSLPISGGVDYPYTSISYGTVGVDNLWLTYPADAGDDDLAVHIRTRTVAKRGNHRAWVKDWLDAAARLGPYYGFTIEDFFLTEAYLQAPGTAVQPTPQGSETSATWTGKAIAFDSAAGSIQNRGSEIGGDATVTINFGASPTVDVSLTDLRSARSLDFQRTEPNGGFSPSRYPGQKWTGLALVGGVFSDTSGGRSIQGAFLSQGTTTVTKANTVGGIFDVTGMMKGGFVATIPRLSPN